jgi:hypothetical protein
MNKVSAKTRILNALKQTEGYNTFTVKSAQRRFGIKNVSARIEELRKEGYCIYTNTKTVNGNKINVYRLGTPTKSLVRTALSAGASLTA